MQIIKLRYTLNEPRETFVKEFIVTIDADNSLQLYYKVNSTGTYQGFC